MALQDPINEPPINDGVGGLVSPTADPAGNPGTGDQDGDGYIDPLPRNPRKDAVAEPAVDEIAQGLVAERGYSPEKAAEIAASLRANASSGGGVGDANVGGAAPVQGAEVAQAEAPGLVDEATFDDVNQSGIGIGNTEVTEREVQDNELVSEHLTGLLDSGGKYINNARMRAMEMANKRGQFGSSFAAGAAERSAIEAALPIATADAQAYRDAASQNMNALNQFALANIQRATQLDTALLSANTNIKMANLDAGVRVSLANLAAITNTNIANLDARTRTSIADLQSQTQIAVANMQKDVELVMQEKQLTHEAGMEQLKQEGRIELATMDVELQKLLQDRGFDHDINMSDLNHEEMLEVNTILNDYNIEKDKRDEKAQRSTEHAGSALQAQLNYTNIMTNPPQADMDAAAAKAYANQAWDSLVAEFQMINALYPEFEPIVPKRG